MAKSTRRVRRETEQDDLRELETRLLKASRRSPLAAWVMRNHGWLSGAIEEHGPLWGVISQYLTEKRIIVGKDGKPIVVTGDAVRKAFERESDKRSKRTTTPKPQSQPAVINPPVRVLAEPKPTNTTQQTSGDDAVARLRREMARRSGRDA